MKKPAKFNGPSSSDTYAIKAWFDVASRKIRVELNTGLEIAFPPAAAQGLEHASDRALANVHLSPFGLGLHWPDCDADLLVSGLVEGLLGSRAFMKAHLSRAGQTTSHAKALAARQNGLKGGRPRKVIEHA
jgi:hypothetical protein